MRKELCTGLSSPGAPAANRVPEDRVGPADLCAEPPECFSEQKPHVTGEGERRRGKCAEGLVMGTLPLERNWDTVSGENRPFSRRRYLDRRA